MKTPSEVLKKYRVIETNLLPGAAIELAMKEYAKQWVEEAVFWAAKQSESGLPIINEVLPRIQKRIDAQ